MLANGGVLTAAALGSLIAPSTAWMVVGAAAILVLDGRPVLYPWRVLGEGARPFTGYKFRTMIADAENATAPLV